MKDRKIVYMICDDKQIKMTRDTFDYLMTIKHYNKKLKEYIINLQESEAYYYGQYKDYKSRNEKAIEYIENSNHDIIGRVCSFNKLINILIGDDKENER